MLNVPNQESAGTPAQRKPAERPSEIVRRESCVRLPAAMVLHGTQQRNSAQDRNARNGDG